MASVLVVTAEYEFSHGKKPRGRGTWAFRIGGKIVWSNQLVPAPNIFPHNALYVEAKRAAIRYARKNHFRVVEVLP